MKRGNPKCQEGASIPNDTIVQLRATDTVTLVLLVLLWKRIAAISKIKGRFQTRHKWVAPLITSLDTKSDSTDLFSGDSWQLSFFTSKIRNMRVWTCQMIQIAWWTLIAEWFRRVSMEQAPTHLNGDYLIFGLSGKSKCNSGTPSITVSLLIYQHDGQYLKASPTFFMFAFRKWMFRGFGFPLMHVIQVHLKKHHSAMVRWNSEWPSQLAKMLQNEILLLKKDYLRATKLCWWHKVVGHSGSGNLFKNGLSCRFMNHESYFALRCRQKKSCTQLKIWQ